MLHTKVPVFKSHILILLSWEPLNSTSLFENEKSESESDSEFEFFEGHAKFDPFPPPARHNTPSACFPSTVPVANRIKLEQIIINQNIELFYIK